MKIIIVLAILLIATTVFSQEVGRYQAVAMSKNQSDSGDNIFIIDTKEGYLWNYRGYASIPSIGQKGGRDIIYLGKVKPGKKIGDIIEQKLYE
jgi:hypothetical protein